MIAANSVPPAIGILGIPKNFIRPLYTLLLLALLGTFGRLARGQTIEAPGKIAEGALGQVLISDSRANAVFALDKQTMQVLWITEVIGEPIAVAALEDVVLVSNRTTGTLEAYGPKKENQKIRLLYTIGKDGRLQLPGDLAVDTLAQRVFVLDRGDAKVKIFDLVGNFVSEFSPVDSLGRLLAPVAITVDEANQRILVSDYGDPTGSFSVRVPPRVLIYDYAGTYLRQIDGDGIVNGTRIPDLIFSRPVGLMVDHLGHLFLVDCVLSQVFVFDLNNWLDSNSVALLKKLGSLGDGPGQLNFPIDVVVDSNTGDVFVTNNGLRRIEVYRGGGITP